MTVNKAILVGNLGKDPEARTTTAGNTVTSLRVATSERRKVGDEWQDHTEWHAVTCFGKTAENVAKHLTKGRQVYIEGRIQTRKWTDKEGRDRWSTEVIAHEVRFLGSGAGGGDTRRDSKPADRKYQERQPDEIPF